MSQKAEVKVVVNTVEAEAALRRLEAEAARIEAEATTAGRKVRAGNTRSNYKDAKGAAADGHAQHNQSASGAAPSHASATAVGATAGAVVAGSIEKANRTAAGKLRYFLDADPSDGKFHKGRYRTSFSNYLSSGMKVNPNLSNVLSAAHTEFFMMEGLDRSRLMAASMGVGKSRLYNLYGWWLGKDPKQKWMEIYKNDVANQIRASYNALEKQGQMPAPVPSTPVKKGKFSIVGSFKKIGQAAISKGLGVGGLRGMLNPIFGVGVAAMVIKQLGEGAVKRVDVIRKGGVLGWGGHVVGTVGKAAFEFGQDVGYEGWKVIGEMSTLFYSTLNEMLGGFEDKVKDGQRMVKDIDEMHDRIKKKRPGVDHYNPFLSQAAKEVGDHLTEQGRFGTPAENRAWALRLMEAAQRRAEKKSGLGNQG